MLSIDLRVVRKKRRTYALFASRIKDWISTNTCGGDAGMANALGESDVGSGMRKFLTTPVYLHQDAEK